MKVLITIAAIAALGFSACKNPSGSPARSGGSSANNTERNKKIALEAEQQFNQHNAGMLFQNYAPNFTEYGSTGNHPMTSVDSMKHDFKEFFASFPDYKGEELHAVGSGDTVIVLGKWSGTFKQVYRGIKPTGKTFHLPEADIFVFNKDGKITSHRSVQSEVTPMVQLGVPIPKGMQ